MCVCVSKAAFTGFEKEVTRREQGLQSQRQGQSERIVMVPRDPPGNQHMSTQGNFGEWGGCCRVKDRKAHWCSPHVAPRLYSKLLREPRILLPDLDKRIMKSFTQVVKYEPRSQFGKNVVRHDQGTNNEYGSLGQILLEEIKCPDKEW